MGSPLKLLAVVAAALAQERPGLRSQTAPLVTLPQDAGELSPAQVGALRASLVDVGATAVQANADSEKFPAGWLFHHRWRNQTSGTFSSPIGVIKFDTVGGRTTAWLPSAQKAGEAGKKAAAAAKRGAPEKKTKPAKRAKKADAAPTPARRSGRRK